jgi:hypothetical protein
VGGIDGDGAVDLAYGPFWYAGPGFEGVNVSSGEPLKVTIEITGANAKATPKYRVGIDRLELSLK